MSVLNMLAGKLSSTATYAVREWRWIPADPDEFADHRAGTLVITQQRAARNGRAKPTAIESDCYAIEVEDARAFLFCNVGNPEKVEVYRVVVAPHHSGDTCTCDAGRVDLGRKRKAAGELCCKHRCAARAVIAEGGL